MNTGENLQAFRKIIDLCRLLSIALLLVHFFVIGYTWIEQYEYSNKFTQHLLRVFQQTTLLADNHRIKTFALSFLLTSLLGSRGRKGQQFNYNTAGIQIGLGLLLYFASGFLYPLTSYERIFFLYILMCITGFLLIIRGGAQVSRILKTRFFDHDLFNRKNQSFPQEERYLYNEFSINLSSRYWFRDKLRKSWINIINPFRGVLVMGTPGSGKSYFVIRHIITQHIKKDFSMFIYDFKFDDLSRIAYNCWLKHQKRFSPQSKFYSIDFDNLQRSHRCNPLEPSAMVDITDAAESARTILLGLNREWIKKQGDFFVESPINFLTAIIWYLRGYQNGQYCTLPHVMELMQTDYDRLFSLLRSQQEIEVLINPFVSAYLNGAMEQLEGQIASAKIAMARLASPALYYILSGNDFPLDINHAEAPIIVCMGNNPQKTQIYGAVLSLYVNRLIKQVNKKAERKCSLIFDEFPTLFLNNIDHLIATARSNLVATCLGIQDASQLRKDYGREQAEVIMNITGNIISGQVAGDSAKQLSDRVGKIMQERESLSINSSDTSINHSKHLDLAIPPSTISSLSSGEFVGMIADDPNCLIDQKAFHAEILNNHKELQREEDAYLPLPTIQKVDQKTVKKNYMTIKDDIENIICSEIHHLKRNPQTRQMIIRKHRSFKK
ncbi:MAG: conjugal transfer protein MobC [Sphingobacterium sp.]